MHLQVTPGILLALVLARTTQTLAAKPDDKAIKRGLQNCKGALIGYPALRKYHPRQIHPSKGPLRKAGLVIRWIAYSGGVTIGYCVMSPDGRQVRRIELNKFPNLTQP